ncbi:baseplate J/gp47 family protein [Microvirga massiliensis]|uniref:baseplate J/gp47 family protein n=1 Tax=Microvirga massiliensis TaxID=1033741 RepID=UPI00062BC366|nr:baseplate J/gp47 family protein [Microvirga massiliensis]
MPLPLPDLDDRRWLDLTEEARALIPRHAPQWTNHNIANAGIILMEMRAWLAEQTIYRAGQTTDRHRQKFLHLVGHDPEAPRPAWATLSLSVASTAKPLPVPAGVVFEALVGDGTVPFATRDAVTVHPFEVAVVQTGQQADTGLFRDHTRDWRGGFPVAAFGENPEIGSAFYVGFEALPAGAEFTLGLQWQWPPDSRAEREALIAEAVRARRACRAVKPAIQCPGVVAPPDLPEPLPPHHSVRLIWEVFTGAWTPLRVADGTTPLNAGEVCDDTRAFTLDGIVRFNLPPTIQKVAFGAVATPLFYLRCRIVEGAFDAAPQLVGLMTNAVVAEQSVSATQALALPPGTRVSGALPMPGATTGVRIGRGPDGAINAVTFAAPGPSAPTSQLFAYTAPTATQPGSMTLDIVLVGRGDGRPVQRFTVPDVPIAEDTLRVFTQFGSAWQSWRVRRDLDASTRDDFDVAVDMMRSDLTFGDGENGRVCPDGADVFVACRRTLGLPGNVAASTITRLAPRVENAVALGGTSAVTARNPRAAVGGHAGETIAEATARALNVLYAHERLTDFVQDRGALSLDGQDLKAARQLAAPTNGVDLIDLERLALGVPGTRVARVRAYADLHPDYACLSAPGSVTIVIIPYLPRMRPEPSPRLLRTVRRYLEQRRMVTTWLHITGPTYVVVAVRARIVVEAGFRAADIVRRVEDALSAYFDPLTGGTNRNGWPFGRDVYRAEILALVRRQRGVAQISELALIAEGNEPSCGNVSVCATSLVAPGQHAIEVVPS